MNSRETMYFQTTQWLMSQRGVGRRKAYECINLYTDVEKLYRGGLNDLSTAADYFGVPSRALLNTRDILSLQNLQVKHTAGSDETITIWHPAYPEALKQIHDPPLILYLKGRTDLLETNTLGVGIVGTRSPSEYGRHYGDLLGKSVAKLNLTVVSGMALGVDAVAHIGALSEKGDTIAVLGCGVDICYPKYNAKLYQQISKEGLIISEYGASVMPQPIHFPERNRIIAGLSGACVVVEAAKKSGSLITAEMVMDLGREVFALPGPISSGKSIGCHHLIQQGAQVIVDLEHFSNELRTLYFQETHQKKVTVTLDKRSLASIFGSQQDQLHLANCILKYIESVSEASMEMIITHLEVSIGTVNHILEILISEKYVKSYGFLFHIF